MAAGCGLKRYVITPFRVAERNNEHVRRRLLLAVSCPVLALPRLLRAQPRPGSELIEAAGRGDLAHVRVLVESGAPIETRDARGRSVLLAATDGNHVVTARGLIARGADVNAKDDQQDSAYLLAGARGYIEILRATLAAGADLTSTNRYGGTALIPACHYGHVETVRLLLGTAIEVDHVNRLGWTALLEAVILGDGGAPYQEIVRLLLARGAKPRLADAQGVTPLQHALQRGQARVADLLRAAGG